MSTLLFISEDSLSSLYSSMIMGTTAKKKRLISLVELHSLETYNYNNLSRTEIVFSQTINLGHQSLLLYLYLYS